MPKMICICILLIYFKVIYKKGVTIAPAYPIGQLSCTGTRYETKNETCLELILIALDRAFQMEQNDTNMSYMG